MKIAVADAAEVKRSGVVLFKKNLLVF